MNLIKNLISDDKINNFKKKNSLRSNKYFKKKLVILQLKKILINF